MEVRNNEMSLNKLKGSAIHFAAIIFAAVALLFFGCCSHVYAAGTIGSTADLEAAFQNGGQYVLTADVQRDDGLTLSARKELDIDLAGHTITIGVKSEDSSPVYKESTVVDGGRLILRDGAGNGNFKRNCLGGHIIVKNGGELVINGATVTGHDGVVVSGRGSKLTMKSGKIDSYIGVAVHEGASTEITGGTIFSSQGISCGSGSNVSISGGTLDGMLLGAGNFKVTGGTIDGMVWPNDGGSVEISGGTLNTKFGLYGNITLKITGGRFNSGERDLITVGQENTESVKIDIWGGYYSSDPSKWLKGECAAADSDEYEGYPYEVIKLVPPTLIATPYSRSPYDSLILSWNADVRGADHYNIYQKIDGEFTCVFDQATIDTFYFYQMFETGKEYSFYVTAVGSNGVSESAPSNIASAAPVFAGSTELTVSNNGSGYDLAWDSVSGATAYEVWRGDGESGKPSLVAETEKTSYTDSSADSYSVYNYIVKPRRTVSGNDFYADDSNVVVTEAKEKTPVITPPSTDDPAGTVFNLLQARAGKITKTSVQIVWKKVPGAKKYVVYGNKCGTKNKYRKLTETTKTTLTYKKVAGKKVRKGTYYKFLVYALDSKGKVISTSKTVHVATTGGKVGNDKKVTTAAKKGKVTVKKGSKFKLKAKAVPASKKLKVHRHRGMAYESSNKKIATVSSKGVIKGKSKGTCYVYAYTQNGVFAKVKVTVK